MLHTVSAMGEVRPSAQPAVPFVAYPGRHAWPSEIKPAPRQRDWMAFAQARAGKHCLPLLIANQAGWELVNPWPFTATWNGESSRDAITIECEDDAYLGPAHSNFGAGVLSFAIPYVFRTAPGWNLLVRGPANRPKDGISALEGIVETDWSVVSFTMNWRLTRPHHPVQFDAGEPFCMVVPQPRGMLSAMEPELRDISTDPDTKQGLRTFAAQRHDQQRQLFLAQNGFAEAPDYNRLYFRGRYPDDRPAPDHETRLELAEFADRRAKPQP
jgi:hypothetical protein